MPLLPQRIDRVFDRPREVLVLALTGPEDLVAAAAVSLAITGAGHRAAIAHPGNGGDLSAQIWEQALAGWFRQQRSPVPLRLVESAAALDAALAGFDLLVLASGGGRVVTGARPRPFAQASESPVERVLAVTALGAEIAVGASQREVERRIANLVAAGALWGAEPIPRFSTVGRDFVELVEAMHHAAGPAHQSLVADTLRAALFGRSGPTPVNLSTRDQLPHLTAATSMIWWFDADEVLPLDGVATPPAPPTAAP